MGRWDKSNDKSDMWRDQKFREISHVDMYDQELMELKRLMNEKRKFPSQSTAYDLAIEQTIFDIKLAGEEANIPSEQTLKDISSIIWKGGKYRKLIKPTYEFWDDRKKRSTKPKPKRKIKKCKCK